MSVQKGSRVFFNNDKQLGTVTHLYDGGHLADVKSCGQWYTVTVASLKLVPDDYKPRWR